MSITKIAKFLNINRGTVNTFLYRLRLRGPDYLQNCYYKRRPDVIGNTDLERLLVSDVYLKRWACLSLRERCESIRRKFNVTVKPHKLWRFYRRHDVIWR